MELNKDIKAAIINMFYMFRQVKEMFDIMGREMEDVKKAY